MAPGLPAIAASVRSIPLLSVLAAVFAGAAIALIRVIRKKEAGAVHSRYGHRLNEDESFLSRHMVTVYN